LFQPLSYELKSSSFSPLYSLLIDVMLICCILLYQKRSGPRGFILGLIIEQLWQDMPKFLWKTKFNYVLNNHSLIVFIVYCVFIIIVIFLNFPPMEQHLSLQVGSFLACVKQLAFMIVEKKIHFVIFVSNWSLPFTLSIFANYSFGFYSN
jgi:hypothetical protein